MLILRVLLIENDLAIQLREEVGKVESSFNLPILCDSPIAKQLNPPPLDVGMFHLAASTCILDEADNGARVDIDDKWVRFTELQLLRNV